MTRRFAYTAANGEQTEAEVYTVVDFVSVASANSPAITGPAGTFDPSLIPQTVANKAGSLVLDRIASVSLMRGDLVRATTLNHVGLADSNSSLLEATVLGIALADVEADNPVEILVFGIFTDELFEIFPVNKTLFLDELGGITDVRPVAPTSKYLTIVGKSLGGRDILINISTPVTLGG